MTYHLGKTYQIIGHHPLQGHTGKLRLVYYAFSEKMDDGLMLEIYEGEFAGRTLPVYSSLCELVTESEDTPCT